VQRREFIGTLALSLLASLLAVKAQPAQKVPHIGYVGYDAPGSDPSGIAGLRQGLRELGYVENQNIVIEYRYAEGNPDRLPGLIAELTRLKADLILTQGTAVTAAAQREAGTTPIVFVAADPVRSGFVQSLARPGGNITGLSVAQAEHFSEKWLELVKDTVPKASRVGIIWNPTNPILGANLREMVAVAPGLGLQLSSQPVRSVTDIDAAFAAMARTRVAALIVQTDPLVVSRTAQILRLAAAHRVPTIYGLREFVDAGGLMSYGPNFADLWRRAATYVDKILKGAKPADLPVEQPTKFELVINAKTAKALGLIIPPSLLARADQVIE
jgi:putative ABC transport system substrate-binding protein